MNADLHALVTACSQGSENGTLNFSQVLGKLASAGVESYSAELRRAVKIYYLPTGESIEIPSSRINIPVAEAFDAAAVESAVRQSQAGTHTYHDFCGKVMAAGCAGYLVSLLGRRVVYYGRTAETHVEHFPDAV